MAKAQAAKKPATRTTRSARAASQDAAPLYFLLADSYIDQVLQPAGKTVPYYGLPGRALRPVNAEAKSRKAQVLKISQDRKLSPEERQDALRALSDEWNGVEALDEFDSGVEFDESAIEAAEAAAEAEREEADRRAKLTANGLANKGADAGKGGAEAAAAAKFS